MYLFRLRQRYVFKGLIVIIATSILLLTSLAAYAFQVAPRPWASAGNTYTIAQDYSNYGGATWINVAHGAAATWTNNTIFGLFYNSGSNNKITLGYDSDIHRIAWTITSIPYGQMYTTDADIFINVGNGMGFWDGVNPPVLPGNWMDLKTVLLHEMGHVICVDHTNATGQLMSASTGTGTIRNMNQDSIDAVKYLYNPNFSASPESTGYEVNRYATTGSYDDRAPLVGFSGGTWSHGTGWSLAYNNSASYTNSRKRTWLAFDGGRITYNYTMANNRGSAKVYIDGTLKDTINAYSSDARWQVAKTWPLVSGQHVIEVLWDPNNLSTSYVDLDAFTVNVTAQTAGTYENDISQVKKIGNWLLYSGSGPSGNSVHYSKNVGDAITFTFSGSTIKWYFTKAYNRGKANVTIDGLHVAEVDLYSATTQWQQQQTYNVASGVHTIHVSVTGRTSGTDTYIDVDKFVVQ